MFRLSSATLAPITPRTGWKESAGMAGRHARNEWTACSGMSGRIGPERVDALLRNRWTESAGIRTTTSVKPPTRILRRISLIFVTRCGTCCAFRVSIFVGLTRCVSVARPYGGNYSGPAALFTARFRVNYLRVNCKRSLASREVAAFDLSEPAQTLERPTQQHCRLRPDRTYRSKTECV